MTKTTLCSCGAPLRDDGTCWHCDHGQPKAEKCSRPDCQQGWIKSNDYENGTRCTSCRPLQPPSKAPMSLDSLKQNASRAVELAFLQGRMTTLQNMHARATQRAKDAFALDGYNSLRVRAYFGFEDEVAAELRALEAEIKVLGGPAT